MTDPSHHSEGERCGNRADSLGRLIACDRYLLVTLDNDGTIHASYNDFPVLPTMADYVADLYQHLRPRPPSDDGLDVE